MRDGVAIDVVPSVSMPSKRNVAPAGGKPLIVAAAGPSVASVDVGKRDPLIEATVDPFRPISFQPPPPKVPAAPPPPPAPAPKAVAPHFPYRYFGRMVDVDGKMATYLSGADNALIAVREKDVLDNAFRIESVGERQIVLTYLPMDEKLTIAIQSAAD